MPTTLYRAMRKRADDLPLLGASATRLGVRAGVDIKPDADGMVGPFTGGLSTTPDDPARLPPQFRPKSCRGGLATVPLFAIHVSVLADELRARRDPERPREHVFVEPALRTAFAAYETAINSTQARWRWVP